MSACKNQITNVQSCLHVLFGIQKKIIITECLLVDGNKQHKLNKYTRCRLISRQKKTGKEKAKIKQEEEETEERFMKKQKTTGPSCYG